VFSLGSKLYFALAGFAFAVALGYRATTGERQGELILFGVALAVLVVALAVHAIAGQDLASRVTPDAAAPDRRPLAASEAASASPWPLVVAASAVVLALTTISGAPALAGGLIVAFIATVGWTGQAWRDHPTFTPRNRAAVGDRLVIPVALPVGGFLLAAGIAIGVSRVLLNLTETAATAIFIIVGAVVLTTFFLISARPRISSKALTGLAATAFAAVLVAGVGFASAGERPREHKGAPPLPTQDVVAQNLAFKVPSDGVINLPSAKQVVIVFTNKDVGQFHNWALYTSQDAKGHALFDGKPIDHGRAKYTLTTPGPGTYVYVCDFHPAMKGELVIQ
jgi:plastocyanin